MLINLGQVQNNTTATTVVSYINTLEDAQIMLASLGLYNGDIDGRAMAGMSVSSAHA